MTPFIVAEVSASHNGSLDRALEIVDAAAWTGADAVKFQCWQRGTLVRDRDYVIPSGTWAGRNLAELYDEAWTPWEWFPVLFDRARSLGIEPFSSVFDLPSLKFLEGLGCPRYKISSFEILDLPLIRAVAKIGKPMIISTGMATDDEIRRAAIAADEGELLDTTLLKCTSAYPADCSEANIVTMVDMKSRYSCNVGISDHSLGIGVAVAATALGATVIEKHLTLRRADGGPDSAFSMEPAEFKAMVTACREAAAAIGEVRYGPTEAELPQVAIRRIRNAHR